jgi:hypothetical protein
MTRFFRGSGPCPNEPNNRLFIWSGREDSNLRPLPPEDASRALIEGHTKGNRHITAAYRALCSRFVLGIGSKRPLGPCPRAGVGGAITSRTSIIELFQHLKNPALIFPAIVIIGAFVTASNRMGAL